MDDQLSNEFKKNVYLKPDEYLNGWAKKCGWKATLVYDSLWRHADKDRKCFPSVELMAEEHGVSRDTIIRGLKTLIEFGLVIKEEKRDEAGKFLCNSYTLTDKSKWQDVSMSPTATRGAMSPTASIHVADSDYKDTHIKDTHISPIYSPFKKYSSLKDISEEDFLEIAERYHVSLGFVKLQFETLVNYCESKGRIYKNYKSALRNFVLGDIKRNVERRQDGQNKRGVDLSHLG